MYVIIYVYDRGYQTVGCAPPPSGGSLSCLHERDTVFILNEMWVQNKMYILVDT
jgi:hypothetical protein